MDTFGALLGPVVAFALLGFVPHAYDAVFMTSFCFALLGLGVLMFFVRNERVAVPRAGGLRTRPTLRTAVGLLRLSPFRAVVIAGGLLSLVTIGDAFIYLNVQRRAHLSLGAFPLLYVGTAIAYLVLAVPAGRIADRVGRRTVFLLGHVFLLGAYLALRLPNPGGVALVVLLGLLGAYYAATDGVLMALASAIVPADARTCGLAVLTTVTAVARFAASGAVRLRLGDSRRRLGDPCLHGRPCDRAPGGRRAAPPRGKGADMSARQRLIGFTVLCFVCIAATAVYLIRAKDRADRRAAAAGAAAAAPAAVRATQQEPHVLFRTWRPPSRGMLGLSELDTPERNRRATALDCERIDFVAGKGICLGSGKSLLAPYSAVLLNSDLEPRKEILLSGPPSRVRISPDGRLAAVTVFQSGHSYELFGGFSTLTTIIDMNTGEVLHDLEMFNVTRDGKPFHAADFNFWGITFTARPRTLLRDPANG